MSTGSDGLPFKEVKHRGLITVSVMAAMIMVILDMTIANVALPHMQASLGAAQDTITWVLTSYIVAQAIATPITGWLSDNIGRKRLFAICVAGFVGSSALCGTAISLEEMVFFRILQGAFGAALAPLSQSVIMDINPRERQGQAMALWGAGIMIAPIIGPTIGAYLTDHFNWRWVFYINVPVGIAALTGVFLFMPDTIRRIRKFDFIGFGLLSIAVGALQFMLDRGAELDWFQSPEVLIELGVAIAAAWMFIIHTATHAEPFLDKRLFMDRNFSAALVLIFVVGIVLLATMALLPPMLQNLFGYPIITVGLVLAPRGLGTMASMMVVGRLVGKIDPRLLVLFGLSLTAISLYQMTFFSIRHGRLAADHLRRRPGLRPRLRLHPALDGRLPDARPASENRSHRFVQPRPQPRLIDRHLDHGGAADFQHADQPRDARRAHQPIQSEPAGARHRSLGTDHAGRRPDRGADRRPDNRAIADDRLSR